MKALLAAVLLSTLAAPVLAMDMPSETTSIESLLPWDIMIDRRSGRCPKTGAVVMREGSTCGGV